MTRAQVVTVLYRIAGDETSGEKPGVNKTPFTDVEDGAYYTNAINWAYETGRTIAGYQAKDGGPSTAFGPNDPVTREQLVVFVWRAAGEPAASDEVGYLRARMRETSRLTLPPRSSGRLPRVC